jgi:hypothetical protein
MYSRYSYYRRPGDMAVSFLAALVICTAVTLAVAAIAWTAGAFSPSCSGPACVTARARTWVCGPAGCADCYWLYFSDSVFTQVSYRQWSAVSVGSAWGSEGSQLRGAGVSYFFQETSEDEASADGSSAASWEDETESYLDDEQTAINDETEDLSTSSQEDQETYSPVRGSTSPDEDEPADTDDSSGGGDDG